jgi:hypothetical protein
MNQRLTMRHVRDVLCCHFIHGLSREAIARSVGIAEGSVTNILQRCAASGVGWPPDPALDDAALEARPFPPVARAATGQDPDAIMASSFSPRSVTPTASPASTSPPGPRASPRAPRAWG